MPRRMLMVAAVLGMFALAGCAGRRIAFPADPGTPLSGVSAIHQEVSVSCRGVRTLTAELSLSGRAGSQRLRGRLVAGFERPGSMRLEGVAPFGPPAFILVTRGDGATLLLPRENSVLRGVRAEQILGALTGVALAPADLQAILTGCVEPDPMVTGGRLHQNGLASMDLAGGGVLLLEQRNGAWRLRGARRDGWELEYPMNRGRFPAEVRLRSTSGGPVVDLVATLSQVETNTDLDNTAFEVVVSAGATPITLDDLRGTGPLREDGR